MVQVASKKMSSVPTMMMTLILEDSKSGVRNRLKYSSPITYANVLKYRTSVALAH
jgi:hypothetical protein